MRICPYCNEAPRWYPSRLTSFRRGADHWILSGCAHVAEAVKTFTTITEGERADYESKWDAHAEVLFARYTETIPWDDARKAEWDRQNPGKPVPITAHGWTPEQRAAFRDRIWPKPPPVVPLELRLIGEAQPRDAE